MYATQVTINDQKVNFLFQLDQEGCILEDSVRWFSQTELVLGSSVEFSQMMRSFQHNIDRGAFELVQDDLYKPEEHEA